MTLMKLLHAVVRDSDVGVVLCSTANQPLLHNPRALEIWGLVESAFQDTGWSDRVLAQIRMPPGTADQCLTKLSLSDLLPVQRLQLNDGRWIRQTRRPIDHTDPDAGMVWLWSDITAQVNLERSLQQGSDLLKKLTERVPGIIFKFKMWPDGRSCFPYMSDAVATMYPGVTPESIREDARPFFAFRHPDDAAALQASMLRSAATMEPWDHEYRLILPDHGVVWRHGTARPEKQDDGSIAWHGIIMDITERKRIEEALRLTSSVFDTSGEGIVVVDESNAIVTVNPSFTRITGYDASEVLGQLPCMLNTDAQAGLLDPDILSELNSHGYWEGELWGRRKNGDAFPAWLKVSTIRGLSDLPTHLVAVFEDISEKKKTEERFWQQANFDYLTQLPNRRLLLDRLRQELLKSQRNGEQVALLFVDLDNFKEVNDTLGHDAGDQLLIQVAGRLTRMVRESDTVARLGGDEFTVMLVGPDVAPTAHRIARAMAQEMVEPFAIGVERVHSTLSIGISVYPTDATDVETLFKHADQALYAAKHGGRNQFSWFTSDMQVAAVRRRKLGDLLHDALDKRQFEVYYQPVVDLQSRTIVKAEALLRWHLTDLPAIGPAEFIPIAEELGLIHAIGDWVFREVAQLLRTLDQRYGSRIQIAVNKSPKQFNEADPITHWGQYLESLGVPSERMAIEITEGLLLDHRPDVIQQLHQLRAAGLQVALDDFGTGYSAMSYLLKFQLDMLKIDQSFVRNMESASGQAIVEAMVAMAHKLGLKVVAEGVEHVRERDFLQSIGCDFAQGYLFAKPMPAGELERLLQSNVPGALFAGAGKGAADVAALH